MREHLPPGNQTFSMFAVDKIVDNTITDFDLFINISDHLILYGSLGYHWLKEELENLLKHGHTHFLIRHEDLTKVKMYEEINRLPRVDMHQGPKERIQTIEQIGASFIKCLYEGELTPACVEKAETIATSMTQCIMEDNSCIQLLSGLADYDQYVYYHSIRVGMYSLAIAIEMGLTDETKLREIALGGIFHDIGKKDVGLNIINKVGALTNGEWKIMRSHPILGHNVVKDSILSHVPREIVLHHHEKLDGSGYPDGLDKNSILPEVQIACMADIFDALTSSRSYQQKRSRYEALDFIKHKMLTQNHVANEPYRGLIHCLAK
ncbi:MAG: HD-GYP domain-containing protein [Oligoflexales bacterium]